jgi:hypothetical protein
VYSAPQLLYESTFRNRGQKFVDQNCAMFGISQLGHKFIKRRIMAIRDPFTLAKSLEDRFHCASRQQRYLLGVYSQIRAAGSPRYQGSMLLWKIE